MNKIEALRKQSNKINKEISRLLDKKYREVEVPKFKRMVGQCFAYRNNSYGGSDKADCWDVFKKIIGFIDKESFSFVVEEFEIDKDGNIKWEVKSDWVSVFNTGYEKITSKEYEKEKDNMLAEMETQAKMRR